MGGINKVSEKGFTMIELIIVVAIVGILAGILVPNFSSMSKKAKLLSDIRSIEALQRYITIYKAEYGEYPDVNMESGDLSGASLGESSIFATNLINRQYINKRYFAANGIRVQTDKIVAEWSYSNERLMLDTSSCDAKVQAMVTEIKNSNQNNANWLK